MHLTVKSLTPGIKFHDTRKGTCSYSAARINNRQGTLSRIADPYFGNAYRIGPDRNARFQITRSAGDIENVNLKIDWFDSNFPRTWYISNELNEALLVDGSIVLRNTARKDLPHMQFGTSSKVTIPGASPIELEITVVNPY